MVAIDGFTGYKSTFIEAIDKVTIVMAPFPVVAALAGAKLDECRQRLQQETLHHQGRTGDPLYGDPPGGEDPGRAVDQKAMVPAPGRVSEPQHAGFETTWSVYQEVIEACETKDRSEGRRSCCGSSAPSRRGFPAAWPS